MIRKILLAASSFGMLTAYAQKSNVESAAIYMNNLEVEDAKKAIDAAAVHEETKNDPKMWFYRTMIYDTIYRNPQYANLDKDVVEKFAIAAKNCVDGNKKYDYYCRDVAIINSAFASYNKALEQYNAKDYASALKFFNYVLAVMPYDKERVLTKNNITEKSIILTMADMALKANNNPEAKKHLQKLIDMDYNDHLVYLLMSNLYFTEGDTAKGMSFVEMGRKRFPTEKDLINQELNIYLAQGRQDVLLSKLNETLESDPENATLLFVRGNVYDNYAANNFKRSKTAKDTAEVLAKKARNEKVPANKAKWDKAAKQFNNEADSTYKLSKAYVTKAEADYNKVIEISPENIDAYYNLGALTNNKTTEIVDKMNALPYGSPDYDKKFSAMKKVQDSILNVAVGQFTKALELAEAMPEDDADKKKFKTETIRSILSSLQSVYANLGDEKKTMETKKRKDALGK